MENITVLTIQVAWIVEKGIPLSGLTNDEVHEGKKLGIFWHQRDNQHKIFCNLLAFCTKPSVSYEELVLRAVWVSDRQHVQETAHVVIYNGTIGHESSHIQYHTTDFSKCDKTSTRDVFLLCVWHEVLIPIPVHQETPWGVKVFGWLPRDILCLPSILLSSFVVFAVLVRAVLFDCSQPSGLPFGRGFLRLISLFGRATIFLSACCLLASSGH